MVVDICARNSINLEEAFANFDKVLMEATHELQMGILLDKYNYLQENGVVMEAEEAKPKLKDRVRTIIDNIWNAFVKAYNAVVKKINTLKETVDQKIQDAKEKAAANKAAKEAEGKATSILNKLKKKIKSVKEVETEEDAKEVVEEIKKESAEDKEQLRNLMLAYQEKCKQTQIR